MIIFSWFCLVMLVLALLLNVWYLVVVLYTAKLNNRVSFRAVESIVLATVVSCFCVYLFMIILESLI